MRAGDRLVRMLSAEGLHTRRAWEGVWMQCHYESAQLRALCVLRYRVIVAQSLAKATRRAVALLSPITPLLLCCLDTCNTLNAFCLAPSSSSSSFSAASLLALSLIPPSALESLKWGMYAQKDTQA